MPIAERSCRTAEAVEAREVWASEFRQQRKNQAVWRQLTPRFAVPSAFNHGLLQSRITRRDDLRTTGIRG